MRMSRFFIDRPIFAAVVSLVFVILGVVSFGRLPVAQYPEIAPPIINVTGQYPGASAEVVAATVVTPLEQQINGVENMLYVTSNATGDGRFTIAVTFELGTNLDIAQVQVQNRVAIAQPRLPVGRAQHRRHRGQGLARPDDGRAPLFARQVARHALHLQLRQLPRHRRAEPHQRRRLDHRVRRPRLLDARLARSRSPAVARADDGRCRHRVAGAERPGRLGRAEPAARGPAARVPGGGADAGPARRSRPVRRHPRQADARRRGPPEGRGAGWSWRRSTTPPTPTSIAIPPSHWASSSFRAPTRSPPPRRSRRRWTSSPRTSPKGSSTPSSTIRPSSSSSRSTPSSRPSSRRSSWSCWW